MLMHGKKLLALLGCCMLFGNATSYADNAPAAAILKLPISVRQVGMGDLSLGREDLLRAWSNPALLASQATEGVVAIGGASMFDGEDTTLGMAIGWRPFPMLAIGGLMSSYGASFAEVDEYGELVGSGLERSTMAGGVVGALRPLEWLYLGVTGKFVMDKVLDESERIFAFDAGIAFFRNGILAGVAARNMGWEMYSEDDAGMDSTLPTEMRVGASYCLQPFMVTAGIEFVRSVGVNDRIVLGIEWRLLDVFAFRMGMADVQSRQKRISVGLSAMRRGAGIDYAFLSHPLGATHRAGVSYAFGRAVRFGKGIEN